MEEQRKVPVTVLTGYLGAGKTTLLNRILTESHGQRIAVIENEFGEIGIDNALVIGADEEIFEMNNGCICCTVRGDLIRILGQLMRRRDKFDRILVETTGLADPAPVAQTFFVDDEIGEQLALDGIVTMIDAKHVLLHLDDSDECKEQIAFADVIVLNKCDLVSDAELDAIEARVRSMNAVAKVRRSQNADVPLADVLDVGGFDLSRALEYKPTFLEPEYPFEWAGVFALSEGSVFLETATGPDPTMKITLVPVTETSIEAIAPAAEIAMRRFSHPARPAVAGRAIDAGDDAVELDLASAPSRFELRIPRTGAWAIFTEHLPAEFDLRVVGPDGGRHLPISERELAAAHEHDETVGSVGIRLPGELDPKRLDVWISTLLREQGTDIFRSKGILAIAENPNRYVFQGVHMLFGGRDDRPWADAPRVSELVFIGRGLDRAALTEGLRACLR